MTQQARPSSPSSPPAPKPRRPKIPAVPSSSRTPLAITASPHDPLHGDPDTSMVESLKLHLISEHDVLDALGMADEEAEELHQKRHANGGLHHDVGDHRFRVATALGALKGKAVRAEQIHALVSAPAVAFRHRD